MSCRVLHRKGNGGKDISSEDKEKNLLTEGEVSRTFKVLCKDLTK